MTYLNVTVHSHTKIEKKFFFLKLEMFDAFTTGDTAHIDTIFKFLPLCRKLARTSSTSSLAVNGRPLDFCLHRHPVSVNCLYHALMVLSVRGSFTYSARNARCTVTTDLLCDIPTHKTTCPPERPFAHYIHSCRLAAEMWTTMKTSYWRGGKKLSCSFYLYRCRKYMSYSFPMINFCKPGVHYETPCIF
jgi:hypothetical protein